MSHDHDTSSATIGLVPRAKPITAIAISTEPS
jgi:hypothetical protein